MKWILFDFDGTLVDSTEAFLHAWNEVARTYQFIPAKKEDIPLLLTYTMKERAAKYQFPMYKLPIVLPLIYKTYRENMQLVTIKPTVREKIEALQTEGYRLAVLSSNAKVNIEQFLHEQQLNAFEQILTSSKLFGKDAVIKKFIKAQKVPVEHVLYVGDETRDIVACQKVGLPVAAIAWGFDARPLLEAAKPSYIVDDFEQLHDIITAHFAQLV